MATEQLHYDINCPYCLTKIHIPFFKGLEAKALEDFDMAEISAQDKLLHLESWLYGASLIALLKYWLLKR